MKYEYSNNTYHGNRGTIVELGRRDRVRGGHGSMYRVEQDNEEVFQRGSGTYLRFPELESGD
jgi:hypothetical protein